jgi:hypothetical protein
MQEMAELLQQMEEGEEEVPVLQESILTTLTAEQAVPDEQLQVLLL